MTINEYIYLYPPRAEKQINPKDIDQYDDGTYIGQPKYNGSCCCLFLDGTGNWKLMNRHNEPKTNVPKTIDFSSMNKTGEYMVLAGELMNKNKCGEYAFPFNNVFVVWDILVHNSQLLHGQTFLKRAGIIRDIFNPARRAEDHVLYTKHIGIFVAPNYETDLSQTYHDLIKTDAYEGLVIKKKDSTLEFPFNAGSNSKWQLKIRKPTKNYSF